MSTEQNFPAASAPLLRTVEHYKLSVSFIFAFFCGKDALKNLGQTLFLSVIYLSFSCFSVSPVAESPIDQLWLDQATEH